MKPFVFIVGHPRSGTTLLAEQLQARGVSFGEETHILKDRSVHQAMQTEAGLEALFAGHARLQQYAEDAITEPQSNPLEFLMAICENRAQRLQAALPGEKTPDHWFYSEEILQNPRSRIVFCIRDVRDVVDSMQAVAWGKGSPLNIARTWMHIVLRAEALQQKFPDRVWIHKHESFLENPDVTPILQWLGAPLDASPVVEASFAAKEKHWKAQARAQPDAASAYKWKKTGKSYAWVARVASKQLVAMDYEVSKHSTPTYLLARAAAFAAFLVEKLWAKLTR